MVEEFKVSLFAQEVGTAMPVSPKRLDQQLEIVRQHGLAEEFAVTRPEPQLPKRLRVPALVIPPRR